MSNAAYSASASTAELLESAVHRHSRMSMAGLSERLFTLAFQGLVYAQIWEDPIVDLQALELTGESRVVAITSGGCNLMSYLTASPAEVVGVDLNAAHVALARLKQVAARTLPDHETFFSMFGATGPRDVAAIYDRYLSNQLDPATGAYWSGRDRLGRRRIRVFERNIYRTDLLGRFIGAAHLLARLNGVDPRGITAARDRSEQIEFYEKRLRPLFDRRLVRWMLASPVSLFGLGIPPAQYKELGTGAVHMADVVRERLRKLATDFDLTDNYFAWQAFARSYSDRPNASLPPYLQASNFAKLREAAHGLSVHQASLTDYLDAMPERRFDRFVLLDAQDWMNDALLERLWRGITRTAAPGARVIFRTASEPSIIEGRLPPAIARQWTYLPEDSRRLHALDRSAIYGGFHIYHRVD